MKYLNYQQTLILKSFYVHIITIEVNQLWVLKKYIYFN